MTTPTPFEVDGPLPEGRTTLIEASAGTGKTYALAALAVRFVAERGVPISRVLIVTFTRAATAELRDRIRLRLIEARQHLSAPRPRPDDPVDDPVLAALDRCDDAERSLRRDRLIQALSDLDAATISTIHGYCSQVRSSLGVLSEEHIDAVPVASEGELIREVCGDLFFQALTENTASPFGNRNLDDLVKLVQKARTLTGVALAAESGQPEDQAAVEFIGEALDEIDRRLRRSGGLSFDSLLSTVRDAIRDDEGLAAKLRSQFDVALIDEFQDTDPVQWEIFETLFAREVNGRFPVSLVLVGDPKQAIYSFRGGDIHTYLAARETARTMALTTNHRSDPTVLAAMNLLGEGQTFGDAAIAYQPVAPSHRNEQRRVTTGDGGSAPGLAVRVFTGDPARPEDDKQPNTDRIRTVIAADLATTVHGLISDAHIETPGREPRPVRPADIGVLVGSTSEAYPVVKALRRAQVPAVLRLRDDVADSPARSQWRLLLHALDRPASLSRAAAVAVSWFFGWEPADLAAALTPRTDADSELTERLAGLQHQLTVWDRILTDKGISVLFGQARRSNQMVERMLARSTGERDLTDLEHLAELIHLEAGARGRGLTAGTALTILDGLGGTPEDEVAQDTAQRRIESDAEAVQIMTIHAAKGLQFPFVLLPGLWSGGNRVQANVPYSFYDADQGRRVLDVSSRDQRPTTKTVRSPAKMAPEAAALARQQNCGDQHRLTYVAMTRAEHQTIAWWAKGRSGSDLSGLGRLLFGGTGEADTKVKLPDVADGASALTDRFDGLGAGDDISVTEITSVPSLDQLGPLPADPGPSEADELTPARLERALDRLGRVWSFSSLSTNLHAELPPFEAGDVTIEFSEDRGTNDEPSFHHLGGGRDFGNLIHHVLEHLNFQTQDPQAAVAELLDRPLGHRVSEIQRAQLPAALAGVIRTPLGSAFDQLQLADLSPQDRLNELSFHLPLAPGEPLSGESIGTLIADHLPTEDPLRPWALDLARGLAPLTLQGFLTGSIDLTFRYPEGDGHRYCVADYKTNNLALRVDQPTLRHYTSPRLVQAMVTSQYALQALIYTVALHRYLKLRLPGYEPGRHLGPVAYLFVRGMIGPDTPVELRADNTSGPTGVFSWSVPPALVEDLSAHFARHETDGRAR